MENTARIILEINNELVFMERYKMVNGEQKHYFGTIGGHLDNGESFEDAAVREAYEELGIQVELKELFFENNNTDINTYEKYYIAEYISGELGSGQGEEFDRIQTLDDSKGIYKVVTLPKDKLNEYNIQPQIIKEKLIERYG